MFVSDELSALWSAIAPSAYGMWVDVRQLFRNPFLRDSVRYRRCEHSHGPHVEVCRVKLLSFQLVFFVSLDLDGGEQRTNLDRSATRSEEP